MNHEELKALDRQYVMQTYGRFGVDIDHGKGATLWNNAGEKYIDFTSSIGVCSVGYANETWISEDIIQGYCAMFKAGYGYSIEVWENDMVIGGLYGFNIGKGCFGESMFSTRTDVSKMAFYTLM